MEEFGFKTGKAGWRKGVSLLKTPVVHIMNSGTDVFYDGFPIVATNGSIVAAVSDMTSVEEGRRPSAIGIRDAQSLVFSRLASSSIENKNVTICGRVGSEIIVTSNSSQIHACRGNDSQQWNIHQFDQAIRVGHQTFSGIQIIGCETHLIYTFCGKLYLYKVESTSVTPPLFYTQPQQVVCFQDDYDYGSPMAESCTICWAEDGSSFSFLSLKSKKVYIYGFDASLGNVTHSQTLVVDDSVMLGTTMAFNDNFVAVSTRDKKIDIWERKSGTKCFSGLCDVCPDDELDEEDREFVGPEIPMIAMGHLLITSSHLGCAICVWNMKTGHLLKRHDDANEQRLIDQLPDGMDISSMVYIECLNAFFCLMNYEIFWSFPLNRDMKNQARSIRRREALLNFT